MTCSVCQDRRLCPYCGGNGRLPKAPYRAEPCHRCKGMRTCPACGGSGHSSRAAQ